MKTLFDGSVVADNVVCRAMLDGLHALDATEISERQAEENIAILAERRDVLRRAFNAEGLARIAALVPAWDSFAEIKLLASIWNMLGVPNAAQSSAKNIYVYVVNVAIPAIDAAADVAALSSFDPIAAEPLGAGAPVWPT